MRSILEPIMVSFRLVVGTTIVGTILGLSVKADDRVTFQPDFASAQALATQTNRLLVVHFWAPWCEPCLRMEHDVLSAPGLGAALEKRFVLVKVNRDRDPELAEQLGVRYLPTDVVLSPDGKVVGRLPASLTPQDYLTRLHQMAAGGGESAAASAPVGVADPAAPGYAESPVAPGTTAPAPSGETAAAPRTPPPNDEYLSLQAQRSRRQATLPYDQAAPPAAAPLGPIAGLPADAAAAATQPPAGWAPDAPRPAATDPPYAPATGALAVPATPAHQPWPENSSGLASSSPASQAPPPVAAGLTPTSTAAPQPATALGLDGYCPVQLYDHYRWVPGRPQWGAVYEGRTYLFAGPEEQRMFLADPARYSPVAAGIDPVIALDQGQAIEGRREFGVVCDGRIFLFANEASLHQFEQNPDRYTGALLQARRPTTVR